MSTHKPLYEEWLVEQEFYETDEINELSYKGTKKKIKKLFKRKKKLSPLQKEYRKYFKGKLKKYGVNSPAELSSAQKTKFFNEIKAGWIRGKGKK